MFISGMFHPLLRSAHCADHDGPRRRAASPPPCKWCSSDMGACFRRYSLPYEHPRSGGLSDPTAPPRPETQQSHQASDTPISSRWAHDAPDTDSLGGPPVRGRHFAAESPPHPEEGTSAAHLLHHVTHLSAHQFSTRGHKTRRGRCTRTVPARGSRAGGYSSAVHNAEHPYGDAGAPPKDRAPRTSVAPRVKRSNGTTATGGATFTSGMNPLLLI